MNNIISIRDAALTYQARNGEVEALGGVSFDVAEGEFVSIGSSLFLLLRSTECICSCHCQVFRRLHT